MSKRKSIICLDTGQQFASVREACDFIYGDEKSMRKACRGQLQTYRGMKWRYLEEHIDGQCRDISKVGKKLKDRVGEKGCDK
jgi:hypothetical protein